MGTTNNSKYYYSKNGEVFGPYSIDTIVEFINKNTLVCDLNEGYDFKVASKFLFIQKAKNYLQTLRIMVKKMTQEEEYVF